MEPAPDGESGGIVAWVDTMVGTIIRGGGCGDVDSDMEQEEDRCLIVIVEVGIFNFFSKSVNCPIKLKFGEIFGRIDLTRLEKRREIIKIKMNLSIHTQTQPKHELERTCKLH